jgi:polysaccharide biosynthesis protein PslG
MRAVVIVAVCALLLAAAPASAAAPKVPQDWLGVVADGPLTDSGVDREAEWAMLADSGATTVRTPFYWSQGQPAGPGAVDYAAYDAVVLAAARHGVGVLPIVQGTPQWAASKPGDGASPPRDGADLGRFLQALVARYGKGGSLWAEHPELTARPIRDWQVWNEPNIDLYWSTQPFAKSFVKMLRGARAGLRAADPNARLVLAGLPNKSWAALRTIYAAGGRKAFDVVALHPYTGKPVNVIELVRRSRRIMKRYGDGRKPVWVTELSWPAALGKLDSNGFETSEKGQAKRLRRGLELLAANRRKLRIGRVYWYTWLSLEGTDNSFGYSGLRRVRNGQVVSAPALAAFREMASRLKR